MEQPDVDHVALEPGVFRLTQIGISIADPLNRRLIEGAAAQLGLTPTFLDAPDVVRPELLKEVELLVIDHALALSRREVAGHTLDVDHSIRPALVAVIASSSMDDPLLPTKDTEPRFDGLLLLPQSPAIILAQLSAILHSHRAHTRRFQSAMHKLHFNRSIFRSVRSGILISKAIFPDFPIAYVNPAFEEMTGYTLDEVRGKNCRFLQRDDRDQPALPLIREALRANRETVAVLRNYRKDGTAFWNELFLSPIRDLSGVVTHFVGIQNDISARVAFEDALRESEKLAAAGRLAASIAHEINNPLEAVTNMLYLARGRCNNEESERYLEKAAQELQRVSLLTAQSLRFYKQSTRPQAIRPTDLISSVVDVYNAKILNNNIAVERRDRTCEPIVCLESEIRQVLSNLVQNAIDAMRGPNRRLVIRAREATEWRSGRKGVKIAVADTGTGMTAETIKNIYTAFYTTKEVGGMGLGLWVSSGIIERHQGKVRVRSRQSPQGSGTVFTLFLPYRVTVS